MCPAGRIHKSIAVFYENLYFEHRLSGNEKEIKAITAKYSLSYTKSAVNRLDGLAGENYLTTENMKAIFGGDLSKAQVHLFDDANNITLLKTTPYTPAAAPKVAVKTPAAPVENQDAKDAAGLKNALSRKMMDAILKKMEAETRIKIFSSFSQE